MDINKNKTKLWYALYVITRHEKKIAKSMLEKNIECYIPLIKKMHQWSDRKKLVETPLIPGYAFVLLGNEEITFYGQPDHGGLEASRSGYAGFGSVPGARHQQRHVL